MEKKEVRVKGRSRKCRNFLLNFFQDTKTYSFVQQKEFLLLLLLLLFFSSSFKFSPTFHINKVSNKNCYHLVVAMVKKFFLPNQDYHQILRHMQCQWTYQKKSQKQEKISERRWRGRSGRKMFQKWVKCSQSVNEKLCTFQFLWYNNLQCNELLFGKVIFCSKTKKIKEIGKRENIFFLFSLLLGQKKLALFDSKSCQEEINLTRRIKATKKKEKRLTER